MRCPLHDGRCRSTIPQLDAAILPSRCQQGLLLAVILVPGQSCDVATWVGAITPACRSPHLQVVQEDGPLPVPGCRRQSCHAQLQHRGAMGLQPLHHPAGSGIPGGYSCVIGRTDQQPWLYWHHLQLRRRASMARQLPACHAALPPQADPGILPPEATVPSGRWRTAVTHSRWPALVPSVLALLHRRRSTTYKAWSALPKTTSPASQSTLAHRMLRGDRLMAVQAGPRPLAGPAWHSAAGPRVA